MAQSSIEIKGITYASVRQIADKYQIDRLWVRNILGISESTQFRYEKNNPVLNPNLGDRWGRCIKIIKQAQELFEDEQETRRWLSTPKQALNNKIPLELLDTDSGCRQVEKMLMQASYGVFS
ncbi:MAG: DUF2384 domain-containing protein [Hydrococcus sp. SU_1_0]|nr:DUF2384 domain-containing protein [Hydrococcus sp. SU_1_0]NJO96199.1 DUF2384 domain-containing protein [Pleurocapsa sp. CRU_1_2]